MCEGCGGSVDQSGRGRPRRWCTDCRPRNRELTGPEVRLPTSCERCGELHRRRSRFCSRKCRGRGGTYAECAECGVTIWIGPRSRPAGEARCKECHGRDVLGCGTAAAYRRGCRCSECRRAMADAMRGWLPPGFRHHWISPSDRVDIYDRDSWTCQLCGDPVDLTVHHLHRLAPTLDHIVPRSLQLIPDDSPENLRCAHRGCNASRGARV